MAVCSKQYVEDKHTLCKEFSFSALQLLANAIILTNTTKYLRLLIVSKLLLQEHVDCLLSQSFKMLGLIRVMTYSFSILESLPVLC